MTQATMRKGREGWEAESEIPLIGRRVLKVHTRKTSRGLRCSASAVELSADGRSYTWVMFGDFGEKLADNPTARCTEKTVKEMHAAALVDIEAVKARALAFYAAKETKEQAVALAEANDNSPMDDPMDDVNYVGHPSHY